MNVWIGETEIAVESGVGGSCTARAAYLQDGSPHDYQLTLGNWIELRIDGASAPILRLPLGSAGASAPEYTNRIAFGDGTRHASSRTDLRRFLFDPHPGISGELGLLSAVAGGRQAIQVEAGREHAFRTYLLLGSLSGTAPGLSIGAVHLPLNLDAYTLSILMAPNPPPLLGSFGSLDARGHADALFTIPPLLLPLSSPIVLHHACLVLDGGQFVAVSGPLPAEIR